MDFYTILEDYEEKVEIKEVIGNKMCLYMAGKSPPDKNQIMFSNRRKIFLIITETDDVDKKKRVKYGDYETEDEALNELKEAFDIKNFKEATIDDWRML